MIESFTKKWENRKHILKEYIETHNIEDFSSYGDLVKLVLQYVVNDEENKWNDDEKKKYNIKALTIVDDGDYQGTQIFIIPEDTYQPSVEQYIYTKVYYGSCSGCDTLQGIFDYCDYEDKPNEKQVSDLMTLCLHLLQNFKKMS